MSSHQAHLSKRFHNFAKLNGALKNIGLNQNETKEIYKVLAAILHIGNIIFEEKSTTGELGISDGTRIHLDYACQLLNVLPKTLETSFLMRGIEINGSDAVT